MKTILKAENMKYKHSFWKILFFVIPLIPAIIGTINYQQNIEILKHEWFDLWTQHTLFYAFFFFSPMISIAASFLWRIEHKGKNWNMYMTSPVHLTSLYGSKLLILVKLIVFVQLWVGILFFIFGKLVGLKGMVPITILWWLVRGTFGALVIASIQMLFSMLIHNFAIPVMIGFLGGISGFLFSSYGYGTWYPYSQLMMGMNSNKVEDVLTQGNTTFFLITFTYLILFYCIAVLILKKKDVVTA